MSFCPSTLSGEHIFAERGPRRHGGTFSCACGITLDRTEWQRTEWLREAHRGVLQCPCRGTLIDCDYYEAVDRLEWAEKRVGYAREWLGRARWKLEDAMRAYREAEDALRDRQRERRDAHSAVRGYQRTSA